MENNTNSINFIALGGQDEIGCNFYCLVFKQEILIFDVGAKLPIKNQVGINYVVANFSFLKRNKEKIKAIFISKYSLEHCGALHFLLLSLELNDVKIYASELITYILKKTAWKKNFNFLIIAPKEIVKFNFLQVEAFATLSSFPFSLGYAIYTPLGTIIYSGKFIFSNSKSTIFNSDLEHLVQISKKQKNLMLLSSCLGAERKGFTSPNHEAKNKILKLISSNVKRIVFVILINDIFHIIEFLKVIKDIASYQIGIENKILLFIFKFLFIKFKLFKDIFENIKNISEIDDSKKAIIIICENENLLYKKLMLIANYQDKQFKISKNDLVILAAPPKIGKELNYADILDEFARIDVNVVNFKQDEVWSMCPAKEDLKLFYSIFKPKFFVPVNGFYKNFIIAKKAIANSFENSNAIILDNFDRLNITKIKNQYKCIVKTINTKKNLIFFNNNKNNSLITTNILLERQILSTEGVLIVSFSLSLKTRKLASSIDVQMRGIVYINDYKKQQQTIEELIIELLNKNQKLSTLDLRKEVKKGLYQYLNKNFAKRSIILVFVSEI